MGKSNIKIKTVAVKIKEGMSREDLYKQLEAKGIPSEIVEKIVASLPAEIREHMEGATPESEAPTEDGLAAMAGLRDDLKDIDTVQKAKAMIVGSLIERAGIDPAEKITVKDGIKAISDMAAVPMPER